jgi:peptide-methionine (S)-S-oxide reductase
MGCELAPKEAPPGKELATFAGGCFWGLELKFMREPGVEKTSSGYTQGQTESPTYEEVCSGHTGHTEAVQVQSPASDAEMH